MNKRSEEFYNSTLFQERMYTNFEEPYVKFESQYGVVNFKQWLSKEKNRIENLEGKCSMWENEDGKICMTVDHEIVRGVGVLIAPIEEWPSEQDWRFKYNHTAL